MDYPYWKKQQPNAALFPDIEWSRPEQRSFAGKLGIIGGNKLGFAGVAEAFSVAYDAGVGNVKVLLPDALKKSIPVSWTDVAVAPSTISGGLSKEALPDVMALASWSSMLLLIGDAGRNSETDAPQKSFIKFH